MTYQSRGKSLDKFEYISYTDKKLCIISCLRGYLTRRDKHVGLNTDQLIITLEKPFKGASIDTMRRWVKDIFILNNIVDFSPHSCRAASTSKAKNMEVNIDEILKRGCWKNRKSFFIYYDKVITEYAPDDIDFNRICLIILRFTAEQCSYIIHVEYTLWVNPYMNCIGFTSLKLHVSIALKSHSFEFHQECVDKCHTQSLCHHPFTYPHVLTLLTSNSLLGMMIASLALLSNCLSLIHTLLMKLQLIIIKFHTW